MNKIIFTEEFCQPENMLPFTLTRQLQDIRVGILTIREKWEKVLKLPSYDKKEDDYKDLGRSMHMEDAVKDGVCLMIHGNILPTPALVKAIRKLNDGECLATPAGLTVAFRITKKEVVNRFKIRVGKTVIFKDPVIGLQYPWDIFQLNDQALRLDFALLTRGRKSQPLSRTNKVSKGAQVFVEKGASAEHCIINAGTGPVYIGKNATLMEGCLLRGPVSVGEGACLKMGTRVYGATTIGPGCVAGGEIKNAVMFGYSNKAYDGYLGDAVIGEWCNLGAGTTNSNVKNTAGEVRIWTRHGEKSAGNKCGVLMGDYSRTAINTSINTGTVIGVSCNVFGSGLTPKYIPNFSWGHEGLNRYRFDKALEDIRAWKSLKGKSLSDEEIHILQIIFEKYQ